MESRKICRSLIWVTFCTCLTLCAASPTRRKFVSIPETTSSDPGVTNEDVAWDDSDDDFDSEGDGWLKEFSPQNLEYDDYDDAEETNNSDSEFLSPTDTRLVLEDDDQSSLIKVRHTSKNSYPESQKGDINSVDSPAEKEDSDGQFVFTIDEDDEDEDDLTNSANQVSKDDDDFVLEDSEPKDKANVLPHRETRMEDDDDEDDDDLVNDDEDIFESPEENAQVIYGDHVFVY